MGINFWLDRPVFVTGATGLLGSWLVKRLLELQADPVCLVRDWVPQSELVRENLLVRLRVVRGDVCDQKLIERVLGEYEIDTVFHLAAQTIAPIANRNPLSTFETNVAGTWNVLESCRRSPLVKQIVVASSDKAYGSQATLPYVELTPLNGSFPYDVSKSCADLIAHSFADTFALPVAVTRCGNFFGGGDLNWNRIVPGTIHSVLRDQRPIIRSDGKYVRDYFYIEDAVDAYLLLAENLAIHRDLTGDAFNFSYGEPLTVCEIVQVILRLMNSTLEPDIRNEASKEIRAQYLDSKRAREILNWKPTFTLESGLTKTIDWYRRLFSETP